MFKPGTGRNNSAKFGEVACSIALVPMTVTVAGASAIFCGVLETTSTVSSYCGVSGGVAGCGVVDGGCVVGVGCCVAGCCGVPDCDDCGAADSRGATTTTTAATRAARQASFIHAPLRHR